VAALGGFLFGFDTAVINGAVLAIRETFRIGAGLTGFVVASALLGCAVGAWLAGKLADRIGRIKVMVLAAALFLLSAIGSGLAYSPYEKYKKILRKSIGVLSLKRKKCIEQGYV